MNLRTHFDDLYAHMEWADARVWTTVLASDVARNDEALRTTLHHIHMVQQAFLGIWQGEAPDGTAGKDLDAAGLATWGREGIAALRAHVAGLEEASFGDEVNMPWAAQVTARLGVEPAPTLRRDTVQQVYNHTSHHRGQVMTRLRELGETPPLVDFIAWVWLARPSAEWP